MNLGLVIKIQRRLQKLNVRCGLGVRLHMLAAALSASYHELTVLS